MKKVLNLFKASIGASATVLPFSFTLPYFEGEAELWCYFQQTNGEGVRIGELSMTANRHEVILDRVQITQDFKRTSAPRFRTQRQYFNEKAYTRKGLKIKVYPKTHIKGVFELPAGTGNNILQILLKI
jgi:hypothetical protein